MASKRMTANPIKPSRYRPGKAVPEEPSSEEEEQSEEEQQTPRVPPPKATSFPSDATKIAGNLSKVNLEERRRQAIADEAAQFEAEKAARAAEEDGFVTEESEEEEEGSDDETGSDEETVSDESNSGEEAPKKLLRPTFIKKDQRKENGDAADTKNEYNLRAEEEARRKEKADAMIQDQLEKDAAARAAGKKDWDDDELQEVEQVDDTDGLDPETERAAWKLRELKRVKREREVIETAEKEREETERRRNLTKEEREAEDKEFLEAQKEEREGKGKMSYMQKYFHKGAFFQDDAAASDLAQRDIMGSRYADDVTNRELLPQYMQIRDMTRLGRKGRTKYKDLKTEDTGRYGQDVINGSRRADGIVDNRFAPDRDSGGSGRSGANAAPVGERRRAPDGAPQGPRRDMERVGGDRYTPGDDDQKDRQQQHDGRRKGSYSGSRSPPKRRGRSYSKSPPRRRERRRSYSYSRSLSPKTDRYKDDRRRRKRSPSPNVDRYASDKRRRVHV
ncbi:MAG: hypothetical protein Q9217_005712 [Psora testacea]